ncbi:MAG: hypothetical protein NTX19_01375 [Gemmatimonadetes bacterium]|nr:hypothetical protein [Gemmatimonadota bacterium]
MNERAVTRALMADAIDYAGLFPPAGLSMARAVENYASYRASVEAWMLGRFILPVARLEEFIAAFTALPAHEGAPWLLSVIANAGDAAALAAFNARYGSRTRIDTIEVPPIRASDLDGLAPLVAMYTVYAEVPWADDPAPLIAQLGARGIRAKLRTGGIVADAIPPAAAVARFVAACAGAQVSFKATAGLHHAGRGDYALTYEPDSAHATMHGFLNVMGAAQAASAGVEPGELIRMLEGATPRIDVVGRAEAKVAAARLQGMQSFGSCSFDEPVAELRAQGLL